MKKTLHIALVLLLALSACKEKPVSDINIEQAGIPVAEKILAPGLGTIGLITGQKVFSYYLNDEGRWTLDKMSQFDIPENNEGLIALGMGTLGVIQSGEILFHRMNAYNEWVSDASLTFSLPARYDRIISVKMPWELGLIAIENDGLLSFYYRAETGEWIVDETAAFTLPEGITNYFSIGDMTIAITDKQHKLGFYYLDQSGKWSFAADYVLQLPAEYKAVIPWDSTIVAVLMENELEFYKLDLDSGQWLVYDDMRFVLPVAE